MEKGDQTLPSTSVLGIQRGPASVAQINAQARRAAVDLAGDIGAMEVTEFNTGAVRSPDANRERYDLISPIALRRLAETYAEGAEKYSDYNWEKGMPISDILNHAIRHLYLYLSGDRSEDHLAHAMWNCGAAIHSEEKWPHLNTNLRLPGCKPPREEGTFDHDPNV